MHFFRLTHAPYAPPPQLILLHLITRKIFGEECRSDHEVPRHAFFSTLCLFMNVAMTHYLFMALSAKIRLFMNMATIYLFVYVGAVSNFFAHKYSQGKFTYFFHFRRMRAATNVCSSELDQREPYGYSILSIYYRINSLTGNFATMYQMQKFAGVGKKVKVYHEPETLRKHTKIRLLSTCQTEC